NQRMLLCFVDGAGVSYQTEFDLDEIPNDCYSTGFGGDVKEHSPSVTSVYPNPTDDLLFVELRGAEITRIALYDLQGRMVTGTGVHAGAPQQGTTATMNLRNVPAGVYLLRVTDADGKEYHRKIVKR
ncbi:MAG: T9SS type A sorting domain-containing protein, partial [Bacteroidales bacterium]|nr:T9SS type A sorting domain-containing protein [Bacteroidales bacterium]